mmetsp:Transcript_46384/g.108688  ORF Transcript_46384/g.108688 Transcript_46384/m.108688 type:complete len:766 (-) Transcript_46384:125-2422(-)
MMSRFLLTLLVATAGAAKLGQESGALQQDGILKLLETSSGEKETKSKQVKAKTSQMEDMVLLLAEQAKAAKEASAADPVHTDTANISEFVVELKQVLADMEKKLFEQMKASEDMCTEAYDNLTGCQNYDANTTFLPPDFNGDFNPLRESHKECRAWLPEMKQEYLSCHKIRDSLVGQEQALLDSFRDVNIFESPDECTISGDDVLAYYEAMREHFKTRKEGFWNTYYKLENVTHNITKFKCIEQEVAYFQKVAECEEKQLKLEQTACALHERTNESCAHVSLCADTKYKAYLTAMEETNQTVEDAKYEYRAIKRISCLLDAFAAEDMEAQIDICINKRHSTAVINSTCVENHENVMPAPYVVPDICRNGVQSILHPDSDNFNETEYASRGIEAARCMASCCHVDWYSWSTYGNAYVAENHYLIDQDTGMPAMFGDMEDAKAACEGMGSVHCYGIYDTKCDGASEESPVKLIASPGLDLHEVQESAIGSCIIHMELGSGTTTTTTVAEMCTWKIDVSRSQDDSGGTVCYGERSLVADEGASAGDVLGVADIEACQALCTKNTDCNSIAFSSIERNCHMKKKKVTLADASYDGTKGDYKSYYKVDCQEHVWKSLTLEYQAFDQSFRFSGCATGELEEAATCVNGGAQNGVRVLKNRIGQGVGTGSCCTSVTNKVVSAKRIQCDGYLDEYNQIKDKYLTSKKLMRGQEYRSIELAREACLRMGKACWGISDDKCDTVNFMLVDAAWNITEDAFLDSKQHTCLYEKKKA